MSNDKRNCLFQQMRINWSLLANQIARFSVPSSIVTKPDNMATVIFSFLWNTKKVEVWNVLG